MAVLPCHGRSTILHRWRATGIRRSPGSVHSLHSLLEGQGATDVEEPGTGGVTADAVRRNQAFVYPRKVTGRFGSCACSCNRPREGAGSFGRTRAWFRIGQDRARQECAHEEVCAGPCIQAGSGTA
jgi:hypothetical protein